MLKQILILATSTVAAAAAGAASAQETAGRWSGSYVGINAGASYSANNGAITSGTPGFQALEPALAPPSLAVNTDSFIGGVQAGYNVQRGHVVFGVETDIDGLNQNRASSFTSADTLMGSTLTTTAAQKTDYLGTLRGRLGITPNDRLLVYATAGLAYGEVKNAATVAANGSSPALNWSGYNSQTDAGFVVGGGAEYALDRRWSVKAEYLYYNLGPTTTYGYGNYGVQSTPALGGVNYFTHTLADGGVVRIGLNYRF